jgi:hypothetical protein
MEFGPAAVFRFSVSLNEPFIHDHFGMTATFGDFEKFQQTDQFDVFSGKFEFNHVYRMF